ncbi:response regulator transcription factor [Desulfopila sp. IMCC35008]|uniref:response regulator transcription factor n=1 Tax=Desulfopila sp. IMCC35008 TaxID=2653858 RepID=UPI0013D6EE02|nr:response regulator [Desulfopila sp. IMCC35008]
MKKKTIPIFIVDDDQSFGSSLQFMLSCRGMRVDWFESAHAFLDSVPSGQKGIAIVDIQMSLFDGFSLLDQMKVLGYTMPVILTTGTTGPDTRDMAIAHGALGFLQKPFLEGSLMAIIESLERR